MTDEQHGCAQALLEAIRQARDAVELRGRNGIDAFERLERAANDFILTAAEHRTESTESRTIRLIPGEYRIIIEPGLTSGEPGEIK